MRLENLQCNMSPTISCNTADPNAMHVVSAPNPCEKNRISQKIRLNARVYLDKKSIKVHFLNKKW